jgi:hypothetical protein
MGYSKRQTSAVINKLQVESVHRRVGEMLRRLDYSQAGVERLNFDWASAAIDEALASRCLRRGCDW